MHSPHDTKLSRWRCPPRRTPSRSSLRPGDRSATPPTGPVIPRQPGEPAGTQHRVHPGAHRVGPGGMSRPASRSRPSIPCREPARADDLGEAGTPDLAGDVRREMTTVDPVERCAHTLYMATEMTGSEARAELGPITSRAEYGGETTYLTKHGHRAAAVVPAAAAELLEQLEDLVDGRRCSPRWPTWRRAPRNGSRSLAAPRRTVEHPRPDPSLPAA